MKQNTQTTNTDSKEVLHTRDELAKKEGSPYHETSEARELAFKNGWDACLINEGCGQLVKRVGLLATLRQELIESMEKASFDILALTNERQKLLDSNRELSEALSQLLDRFQFHGSIDPIREEGPIEDAQTAINNAKNIR